MNIRLITRVMLLTAASMTASSVVMSAAQAEVKKAKAADLLSARAQVPAPTFRAIVPQSPPSAIRYFGGPKSSIFVVAK